MANYNFDVAATNIFEKTPGVKSYTYKDIGTKNFKVVTISNNETKVSDTNSSLYDQQAIKNAIANIFSFIPGQQILDPEFGNTLHQYLYQPISQPIANDIKRQVGQLLSKYQPRITINSIKVETSSDEFLVKIKIYYAIPGITNNLETDISF